MLAMKGHRRRGDDKRSKTSRIAINESGGKDVLHRMAAAGRWWTIVIVWWIAEFKRLCRQADGLQAAQEQNRGSSNIW